MDVSLDCRTDFIDLFGTLAKKRSDFFFLTLPDLDESVPHTLTTSLNIKHTQFSEVGKPVYENKHAQVVNSIIRDDKLTEKECVCDCLLSLKGIESRVMSLKKLHPPLMLSGMSVSAVKNMLFAVRRLFLMRLLLDSAVESFTRFTQNSSQLSLGAALQRILQLIDSSLYALHYDLRHNHHNHWQTRSLVSFWDATQLHRTCIEQLLAAVGTDSLMRAVHDSQFASFVLGAESEFSSDPHQRVLARHLLPGGWMGHTPQTFAFSEDSYTFPALTVATYPQDWDLTERLLARYAALQRVSAWRCTPQAVFADSVFMSTEHTRHRSLRPENADNVFSAEFHGLTVVKFLLKRVSAPLLSDLNRVVYCLQQQEPEQEDLAAVGGDDTVATDDFHSSSTLLGLPLSAVWAAAEKQQRDSSHESSNLVAALMAMSLWARERVGVLSFRDNAAAAPSSPTSLLLSSLSTFSSSSHRKRTSSTAVIIGEASTDTQVFISELRAQNFPLVFPTCPSEVQQLSSRASKSAAVSQYVRSALDQLLVSWAASVLEGREKEAPIEPLQSGIGDEDERPSISDFHFTDEPESDAQIRTAHRSRAVAVQKENQISALARSNPDAEQHQQQTKTSTAVLDSPIVAAEIDPGLVTASKEEMERRYRYLQQLAEHREVSARWRTTRLKTMKRSRVMLAVQLAADQKEYAQWIAAKAQDPEEYLRQLLASSRSPKTAVIGTWVKSDGSCDEKAAATQVDGSTTKESLFASAAPVTTTIPIDVPQVSASESMKTADEARDSGHGEVVDEVERAKVSAVEDGTVDASDAVSSEAAVIPTTAEMSEHDTTFEVLQTAGDLQRGLATAQSATPGLAEDSVVASAADQPVNVEQSEDPAPESHDLLSLAASLISPDMTSIEAEEALAASQASLGASLQRLGLKEGIFELWDRSEQFTPSDRYKSLREAVDTSLHLKSPCRVAMNSLGAAVRAQCEAVNLVALHCVVSRWDLLAHINCAEGVFLISPQSDFLSALCSQIMDHHLAAHSSPNDIAYARGRVSRFWDEHALQRVLGSASFSQNSVHKALAKYFKHAAFSIRDDLSAVQQGRKPVGQQSNKFSNAASALLFSCAGLDRLAISYSAVMPVATVLSGAALSNIAFATRRYLELCQLSCLSRLVWERMKLLNGPNFPDKGRHANHRVLLLNHRELYGVMRSVQHTVQSVFAYLSDRVFALRTQLRESALRSCRSSGEEDSGYDWVVRAMHSYSTDLALASLQLLEGEKAVAGESDHRITQQRKPMSERAAHMSIKTSLNALLESCRRALQGIYDLLHLHTTLPRSLAAEDDQDEEGEAAAREVLSQVRSHVAVLHAEVAYILTTAPTIATTKDRANISALAVYLRN